MAIGDIIKKIRNLRGLTQKELGVAIGFGERTADVRMAQYESGTRTPKDDAVLKLSEVLNVNAEHLTAPDLVGPTEIMHTLLHLDDSNQITFDEVEYVDENGKKLKHIGIYLNRGYMELYLEEWSNRKSELAAGEITEEEYMEWKINWPDTADMCGHAVPRKQWRKE
ncbi:MAG: hypothetical protein A2Y17_10335 [Clostridiales bacterium GWF2_38_85]|nr:MAG: hypothetical protein A2Y17_10335 [Clostridiales bacterium GWF2_38_85]HBL84865.1 XRE family transcriptional regulator [Clostridiales bacterium]